jgi:hypothetical protein
MKPGLVLCIIGLLVTLNRVALAVTPVTSRLDMKNLHMLEEAMSTPDASKLQIAIADTLGLWPKSMFKQGDGTYPEGLVYKASAVAQDDGRCSSLHLDGFFKAGPQGHIAVDGLFCLLNGHAGEWSTLHQRVTHLPNEANP